MNTAVNESETSRGTGILLVRREEEPGRRFAGYLEEILLAEGFVSHGVLALRPGERLTAAHIAGATAVLLDTGEVDAGEAQALDDFVAAGGSLIAMRPPRELAALCGLQYTGSTTGNGYVIVEARHPLSRGLCPEALQYHGQSDLCLLAGAEALAWLGVFSHRATQYPAVATRRHGKGKVAAFTYDLALSTVTFHQGRPERVEPGPDGISRPCYRFAGQVDPDRLALPQADLQQRFLVKLLQWAASHRHPLPRLWYFPRRARAAALITGDSDGCCKEDIALIADVVESFGGAYTTYILESDHPSLPPEFVAEMRARGHSFGPHIWCGRNPSPDEMHNAVREQTARYAERYGHRPKTYRGHWLIWVGWVDMAKYLAEVGIALDTNFVSGIVCRAGYMTGSGLPMRFIDESGRFIPCSEQPTQWEDDCHIEGTSYYSEGYSIPAAIEATREMFDRSRREFHTMINLNLHPIHVRTSLQTLSWIRETARHCHENGIPMLAGDEWVEFNGARRSASITDLRWEGPDLCFAVHAAEAVQGLTVALPSVLPVRRVVEIRVDGAPVRADFDLVDGEEHALFDLDLEAGATKEVRCRFAP